MEEGSLEMAPIESIMAPGYKKRCVACGYEWGTPDPVDEIKNCPALKKDRSTPCDGTQFECVPLLIPPIKRGAP